MALAIRSKRKKRLFFQRAEQHRLFVRSKLADFVEKQYAGVSRSKQTGAILQRSGESAFRVAEESRHSAVAAQGCAVYIHELALHRVAHLFQFVDATGQARFAGARRPHQQERIAGGNRDLFNAVDQAVERRVPRFDAALQVRDALSSVPAETGKRCGRSLTGQGR